MGEQLFLCHRKATYRSVMQKNVNFLLVRSFIRKFAENICIMRKVYLSSIFACCVLAALAESIGVTAPGQLSKLVSDKNITNLTIGGNIDARDIEFIADSLKELTVLDLADANIMAYESDKPLFYGQKSFAANCLPDNSLAGTKIMNLALPRSLTAIGNGALAGTPLTGINLAVTAVTSIGEYALRGTNISSLQIPAAVNSIGYGAFARSAALETVDLAANISTIPSECFAFCPAVKSVNITANVAIIEPWAFAGAGNDMTVTFAANSKLAAIAEQAFAGAGMVAVNLADCQSLSAIGMYAFANTTLSNVILPASVESLGDGAFYFNEDATAAILAGGVPDYVLAGAGKLNEYKVSGNSDKVGKYAFYNSNISIATIPEGVKTIGEYAFYGDASLDSLALPSTLNSIGDRAFENTKLNRFSAAATQPAALGADVFKGVNSYPKEKLLYVADYDVAASYEEAEQWKEFEIRSYNKRSQVITWEQDFGTVYEGDVVTLTATASSGLDIEYAITKGAEFATLSGNQVSCLAEGDVEITAYQNGNTEYSAADPAASSFTIHKKIIQQITLSDTELDLFVDDTHHLTATTTLPGTVTWASSNSDVATVNQDGLIVAVAEGKATITATIDEASATCVVTVTKKSGVDTLPTAEDITARFVNKILHITAPEEIASLELFEANGVRLVARAPKAAQTSLDMSNFYGSFYIVKVVTVNGICKEFKLSK